MRKSLFRRLVGSLALVFTLASVAEVTAETAMGSNIDSRLLFAFKVSPDQVERQLPEGWRGIGFPKGALKGANFLMVLEDRLLARDAEGKSVSPYTSRAAAFLTLAKGDDGVRLFVLHLYTSNPDYDPFLNAVVSDVTRRSVVDGAANSGRDRSEVWAVKPASGGDLSVTFDFTTGRGNWVSDESRVYSSIDPSVFRIFRYDQLVDLVMSVPVGKPFSGELAVSSTISELSGVFDGSEELVAILNIPVYVREVFQP